MAYNGADRRDYGSGQAAAPNSLAARTGMNAMASSSSGNLRAARSAAGKGPGQGSGQGLAYSRTQAPFAASQMPRRQDPATYANGSSNGIAAAGEGSRRPAEVSQGLASRMAIQKPYSHTGSSAHAASRLPALATTNLRAPNRDTNASLSLYKDGDDDEGYEERDFRGAGGEKGYKQQLERKRSHARRVSTPDDDYDDIYGHYADIDPGIQESAVPYQGASAMNPGRGQAQQDIGLDSLSTNGSPAREKPRLTRSQSSETSLGGWRPSNGNGTNRSLSGKQLHTRGKSAGLDRGLPALASPTAARFGWVPRTWAVRIFLLATLAESAADISIEAVLLSRFRRSEGTISTERGTLAALPVFLMVFGFAHVYQCFLAIDSVINRNTILVLGLVLFNMAFFVYAIIQITEIRDVLGDGVMDGSSETVPVQVLTAAIPVIIGVTGIVLAATAWYIMKEFGWQIYKTIGADRRLKRAHLHYQIFVCLLKFDFFMFIAFCLQLVLVVLSKDTPEYWITMLAGPVALILLVFAWYSVRQEKRAGMIIFMIGSVGGAVYFAYKLFRVWQQHATTYHDVYKSLTVFSVLALILLGATIVMSVRCMMNFGKGLKTAMTRSAEEKKRSKLDEPYGPVTISAPYQSSGPGGVVMGTNYPPLSQYDGRAPVTSPPYVGSGTSPGMAAAYYTSPPSGGGMAMLSPQRTARGEPAGYFDVYSGGALARAPSSNGASAQHLPGSSSSNALLSPQSPNAHGVPMNASAGVYGHGGSGGSFASMHRNPSASNMHNLDRYDSRNTVRGGGRQPIQNSGSANRLSLD